MKTSYSNIRNQILTADPRVKIILAGMFGLLIWRTGPPCIFLHFGGVFALCLLLDVFTWKNRNLLTSYLAFILFWILVKTLADTLSGLRFSQMIVKETAFLGLRLSILIMLGLALSKSCSPRQLGLALSFYLRPFLGRNAWRAALSLALMIHFLPLAMQTLSHVKTALKIRSPQRNWFQRSLLVPFASIRVLARSAWSQALAISARGLDRESAWNEKFPPQPKTWITGGVVALAGLGLAFL